MTQTYFPFDAGSGANITESQWQQMARNFCGTGPIHNQLNEFAVYADSTGMQCKVKSGQAFIQGHYFQSDAEVVMPIATADPTNPRWDRIILRVDWTANTITIAVLQGTPAASPTEPALTQNTSKWEISLAKVVVGAGVATIAAGNITDERFFSTDGFLPYFRLSQNNTQTYSTANADQLITFGSAQVPLSYGMTTGTNVITINMTGVYKIHAALQLSGLNSNILATVKFNVTINGTTTGYFRTIRGATGWDGANGGGVWLDIDEVVSLPAGATIQFYANVGEAPRTIMGLLANAEKLSN